MKNNENGKKFRNERQEASLNDYKEGIRSMKGKYHDFTFVNNKTIRGKVLSYSYHGKFFIETIEGRTMWISGGIIYVEEVEGVKLENNTVSCPEQI